MSEWPKGRYLAGAAGIVFATLSLIVIPLSPELPPPVGASAGAISGYYVKHGLSFLIGNYLGVVAFLPGFVQLAYLAALVHRNEAQDGWLGSLVLVTGTFAYGFIAGVLLVFQALPFILRDDSAALALGAFASVGFALAFVPVSAFAFTVAWATFATRVFGRWFAYVSLFVGFLAVFASTGALTTSPAWLAGGGLCTNAAFVTFFGWTFVLAVLFLKGDRKV